MRVEAQDQSCGWQGLNGGVRLDPGAGAARGEKIDPSRAMGYGAYGKAGGKGMSTQDQECLEHKNQGHCYKAREGWCRYGHWGASGQRLNLDQAGRGSTRPSNGPSGKGGKGGTGVFRDDDEVEAEKDGPPMRRDLQGTARSGGVLVVAGTSGLVERVWAEGLRRRESVVR